MDYALATKESLMRSEVRAITAAYTIGPRDSVLNCTGAGGAFSVSLPTAASSFRNGVGMIYKVTKTDSGANGITIDPSGAETIGGLATIFLAHQFDSVTFQSNGTNWDIIAFVSTGLVTATVASGSAVALTTATTAIIASITVPIGTWDISGQVDFALTGSTSTSRQIGLSLASATLPSQPGGSGLGTDPLVSFPIPTTALSDTLSLSTIPVQLKVTAATPVYLAAQSTFSVGSEAAYGTIRARRVGFSN